jgi:uroporphyrinogen decarboxylase
MTGSELVRRAVLFQGPERVPRSLPEPWGSDFLWVGADPEPGWKPSFPGEDEFGCGWEKDPEGRTMGQVKFHPLADYAAFAAHRWPNYALPERYERARRQAVEANSERKFVLAGIPFQLIHRLEYLRGHAEAWTDPYEHPEELGRLLDKLADIALESVEHFARIGAEGIISADDWGLQDRPMVSPQTFRDFFKPRYARVYSRARQLGMLCFLHSCGHIADLLDDLIEAGVQVIQMDQQENMGVENLAGRFGGRVCFWCPVDIQQTMVHGTVEDVRAYARRLIERFGRYRGGFIAAWYGSPQAVQHTPEKIAAMCEAFVEYGDYSGHRAP